jgi:nucleoside-diphosphate-sugar epimerase
MASQDGPVGVVDADEVGVVAARLLAQKDTAVHNKAKYILNGPEDVTGEKIVKMVEQYIGTRVEKVIYKDMSFVDQMAAETRESKSVISTIKYALVTGWEGKCTASTTSKEVLELAAPSRTPADALKAMLEE